jgi:hypothetical protein
MKQKSNGNENSNETLVVTSIGINGESLDQFSGQKKPLVQIYKNNFFITAQVHLKKHQGQVEVIKVFVPPEVSKVLVLAKALVNFSIVLEGPNSSNEVVYLKSDLENFYPQSVFLIDGSIDRQFLAHPSISDGLYFSVYLSEQREQIKKVNAYFRALSLPQYKFNFQIPDSEDFKTQILDFAGKVLYQSQLSAFMDEELISFLKSTSVKDFVVLLNSSLTDSLVQKLKAVTHAPVVLTHFTLYQAEHFDSLNLFLRQVCPVQTYFYKQEGQVTAYEKLPPGVNLFRGDLDEIRI